MRDSDQVYLALLSIAVPIIGLAIGLGLGVLAIYSLAAIIVLGSAFYFSFWRRQKPNAERLQRIAAYHHKIRELVWVPWYQWSEGFPFVATADVTVRSVFQPLEGANERYYNSALQHLEAYDLVRERQSLVDKIDKHNREVYDFENKGPYSPMITRGLESNRPKRQEFGKKQQEIWKEVQSFRERIQGVINDLEDGRLKGKCDFEREIR